MDQAERAWFLARCAFLVALTYTLLALGVAWMPWDAADGRLWQQVLYYGLGLPGQWALLSGWGLGLPFPFSLFLSVAFIWELAYHLLQAIDRRRSPGGRPTNSSS